MPYCKNCGNEMADAAVVCVKCGAAKGSGTAFCHNCGKPLAPGAAVCTACGVPATSGPSVPAGYEQKSKMAAGLLGIFLGSLGVHNFYLGNTGKALAQLLISILTCGVGATVSGIWGLIEGIMIRTGSIKTDGMCVPLKD